MPFISLSLFHQHYKVAYSPRGLTSWIFYGISLLVVLVIPFIIGLAMQNFWIENNYFYQAPEIAFTNRCALKVRTVKGKDLLWTCNEGFNEEYLSGTELGVLPFFSVYEDDKDANGKYNAITFTITVPLGDVDASVYAPGGLDAAALAGTRDAVASVTFLPEFIYRIRHYLITLNMTAAPLFTFTNAEPSAELLSEAATGTSTPTSASGAPLCARTEADLLFHSTQRLINSPYVKYTTRYTDSPLQDDLQQPADLLQLNNFARYYTSRNQSVVPRVFSEVTGGLGLLSQPPSYFALTDPNVVAASTINRGLWEDLDELNSFTWRIHLRVPPAQIFYVPSYAESIKWGWIQYFVIAYLIQWFMWWVRGLVVTMGLIDTKAEYSTRAVR